MPVGVVVEVERVDVLVLLRRVLRVGDGAVGQGGEPLRMLGDPRVVGRALQGQVERDLQPVRRAAWRDERRGSRPRCPARGWIASWPPSAEPIAHGEPTSSRPGHERVVAPLAVDPADRVDRRQVDHVEAHRGDRRAAAGRRWRRCRAAPARRLRSTTAPSERGKNSYQAENSARWPVDPESAARRGGDQLADRVLPQQRRPGRAPGRPARPASASRRAAPSAAACTSAGPVGRHRAGRAVEHARRRSARSLASSLAPWPASIFFVTALRQVRYGSANASMVKVHVADRVRPDGRVPRRSPVARRHPGERAGGAVGAVPDHVAARARRGPPGRRRRRPAPARRPPPWPGSAPPASRGVTSSIGKRPVITRHCAGRSSNRQAEPPRRCRARRQGARLSSATR